uniref:Uncharacterized protein n=1 Tax=Mus musculus TaxID=10090 RepID=Q6R5C9_MOUSE|nr:unknown [Mus musculus]
MTGAILSTSFCSGRQRFTEPQSIWVGGWGQDLGRGIEEVLSFQSMLEHGQRKEAGALRV